MRYCSIDIETTGLNPERHQIIEFGAVLEDTSKDIPYEELPKFHAYIKWDEIIGEPFALQMNAQILNKIVTKETDVPILEPFNLANNFRVFIKKHWPENVESGLAKINVAGKNFAKFDGLFLENISNFSKHIRYEIDNFSTFVKFNRRILDVGSVMVDFVQDEELPNLQKCLARVGIHKDIAHNAVEDALDVIKVLREKHKQDIRMRYRNGIGN